MKVKYAILTLLVVGLALGLSTSAFAQSSLTVALNKDQARTVAPGDSVVIVAFSVTNTHATADKVIDIVTFGKGTTNIVTGDVAKMSLYEDININGVFDAGVDELVQHFAPGDQANFFGAGGDLDLTTNITLKAGEKRYYFVTMAIKTAESGGAGTLDGDIAEATIDIKDTQTPAQAGDQGGAVNPTNVATVNVVATKLKFIVANIDQQIASAGNFVTGAQAVLEAVDDYGIRDITITTDPDAGGPLGAHTATITSALMSAPGTASGTVSANGTSVPFTAGVATTAGNVAFTLASGTTGDVVLKATMDAATLNVGQGLVGTTMINVAPTGYANDTPTASTSRGAEYYDTNHNGKIDAVSVFFNKPVVVGTTTKTAFTVQGYQIDSDPVNNAAYGGYGIYNGGEYAVSMKLVEGSTYDTNATPQITYDANSGNIGARCYKTQIKLNTVTGLAVGNNLTSEAGVVGYVEAIDATSRIVTVRYFDPTGFSAAPASESIDFGVTTYATADAHITFYVKATDLNGTATVIAGEELMGATLNANAIVVSTVLAPATGSADALILEVYHSNSVALSAEEFDLKSVDAAYADGNDDEGTYTMIGSAVPKVAAENATTLVAGDYAVSATSLEVIVVQSLPNANSFVYMDVNAADPIDATDVYDKAVATLTYAATDGTIATITAAYPSTTLPGALVATITAAGLTEVDKAAPVVVSAITLDSGNGGTANNGKVDGVQITLSEAVDGVSMAAGKTNVSPANASLWVHSTNQKSVDEILMAAGTKVTTDNKTFIFPINEGTFLTTDSVPYIGYQQQDGTGYIIVDNATNVNGTPDRNQFLVDKTNTAADQLAKITVKDAVGPIVLNVTTNDYEAGGSPDGHVDLFTVEFSEEVGIKNTGVTFVSPVFGTYTATIASAVTGKIINYTVTELTAYDTETLATFAYDPSATNTKLFDFGGNEPALYGTGGLTQVNATKDGAKPIIVSVKTGDNYTDEKYTGNSELEATGANGRLDTMVIEFSEKVTTANYSTSAVAANIDAALGQFTYTHTLNSGGPGGAAMTTANSAIFVATNATSTKPAPVWADTPTGDTKTVLTLYHKEMSHAAAGMTNGGDTGAKPSLNYTLSGTVANNFKDAASNTTPGTTLTAIDKAAPFIVNGMTKKNGTTPKVLAAGATAAEEGSWDNLKFPNILTKDTNAITYGSDYNTGDGYIDAFTVKFSETVYTTKADTTTMASAWTVAFDTPASYSTVTLDKGMDFSNDGDININAGTANTEDNNVGRSDVVIYGTSTKMKNSWDTGQMPTLKFNGGIIIYDGNGTATQYEAATDNILAATIALPSFDNAAPVPVVAVGGVKTKEIKVNWSENIYDDATATTGTGTWGTLATGIYSYTDKNATGNAGLSAASGVVVTNSSGLNNGSVMKIATTDTLTLSDVESDSLWVSTAAKVFDNADGVATNMDPAYTQNAAVANAAGVGYKIIINDIIAPYIVDAYTVDVNGNGKIDHIRFLFSEPIKLESIGGYTVVDALSGDVSASWQFEGYTGTAQWNLFTTASGKAASIAANEPIFTDAQINTPTSYVFYLKLQEDLVPAGVTGVGSTGYAPVMTLVAPTMSDNKPNALDINSNEVGAVKSGMIVKDNVGPVLMSAKYISGTELQATFSEDVKLSSIARADFTWKLSTDGLNWQNSVVRITEPSAGVTVLKVTDDADWEDDMVGTLALANTVTDDAATLGTGRGTSYTADAAAINSVNGGAVAYANATYYMTPSAPVPDATKGLVAANVAITIDWTAPVNPGGTTGPSVIAAPADLVLADVPNDNGHWMYASFTVSADHLTYVKSYQFYRQVNFGTVAAPNLQWVYSAVVPAGYKDANNKSVCLVPVAVDGEGTWAVVASSGDVISDMAAASKEGEIPVAMLVDGAEKVAGMVLSDMSATAVGGAIDNIAPTAIEAFSVTSASDASGVVLSWTAPADNGIVGYYGNGVVNNIPIYGVDSYEVYRKTGSAEFALVGTAAAGSTSYTDAINPSSTVYTYYVKSVDSNPEHLVVSSNRNGIAVSKLRGDFTGDSIVNASDFSIFAANYGKKAAGNEATYVWAYDLNNDGIINASDFSVFAAAYGSTLPVAKAAVAEMPTSDLPFTFSANVDDATSTYFLNVNIGKSDALKGFEFFLSYDKENFEFLPNSVSGLVGLNMTAEVEDGIIRVTDWFVGEEFDGTVSFGFKTSGLNRTSTFEILNAMVDDVNGLAAATNVSEFEARALPTVYSLSQNYPNPFNPTTTIDYSMPKSGNVELVIFNTSGQKVRTLVSNVQDAGFYKVVWDGRNDLGEQVASGVYIYKLAADSFSKTAKMNLVK